MASPLTLGSASPVPSLHRRIESKNAGPEPEDTFNLVYMSMLYQGLAAHFPWNVLLAGQSYFKTRLEGLAMARDFLSHFTIIFMLVKYAFLLGGMFVFRRYNPKWQVYGSTLGNSGTFLALTIICISTTISQTSFYFSSLALVLFASLFSAIWEAGCLSILGQFPVRYMQAYLTGSGIAGVVVITVSIASYFIAGTFESENFAKIYFGISTALIIAGFVFFFLVQNNEYYKHYKKIVEEVAAQRQHQAEEDLAKFKDCASFAEIYREVQTIAIAAFLSSTIGFIIFPEFMFHTKSTLCGTPQETWFHRDMFIQLALFLANIFDVVGKLLPMVSVLSFQNGPYILFSLSRAVMIPLYLFGNVKVKGYKLPFPPYLASDTLFYILVSISALSSSYLHTVSIMWAPSRVKPHERSVAIAIILIFAAVGFVLGTTLSMALKNILLHYSTRVPVPS